ncbi:MAG TPA: hypothetical protein VGG06_14635 [Thermoanaerobaculia bacterium]|jgi:hypothetical protein
MEAVAIGIGVLISAVFVIVTAHNPAHIPFRRVALKAAFGIALFVVVYFFLSYLLFSLAKPAYQWATALPAAASLSLAVLFGIVVPQIGLIKDRVVTPTIAKKFSWLFPFFQEMDEFTRMYLVKIINREERIIAYDWLYKNHKDHGCAVDRLFEFYSVEIAKHVRENLPKKKARNALGVFRLRAEQVKIKYLFRWLGLEVSLARLKSLSKNLGSLFGDDIWPIECRDRREHLEKNTPFRRKYEKDDTIDYVLGHLDCDVNEN